MYGCSFLLPIENRNQINLHFSILLLPFLLPLVALLSLLSFCLMQKDVTECVQAPPPHPSALFLSLSLFLSPLSLSLSLSLAVFSESIPMEEEEESDDDMGMGLFGT